MVAPSRQTSKLLALVPFFIAAINAQTSGTFDFLTYNVAGLPEVLNGNEVPGDKATNANTIGSKLAERSFDIVHMQVDGIAIPLSLLPQS